jgi:MFS family permease
MGVVMAASGVGGPLIGGAITDVASWRWIFYVNVPIGLLSLALVAYALRLPKPRSSYRIDLPGALLLASFIVCLLLVTEWGGRDYAWGSTQVLALSAGAVAALGTFLFWERRIAYPIIPLGLFANRTLLAGFPAAFLLGMLLGGSIIFLPTFQQNGFGMSATRAGLALLPYVIAFMLVSAVASSKAGQSGKFKPYLLAGSAVSALALWLLSRMDLDTSYLVIAIYFAVLGLGFGLIMQNLVVVSQNAVRHEELGVTTSTTLSLRGLGMSVGVALFGSLLSRELHGRPDTPEMTAEAIPDILFWGVPLAALTFVLVALLPRPAATSRADSGGDTPATQDTRARTDAGGSR